MKRPKTFVRIQSNTELNRKRSIVSPRNAVTVDYRVNPTCRGATRFHPPPPQSVPRAPESVPGE